MRKYINHIPVDILSYSEILGQISLFIQTGKPHQIVTINSLMYNALLDDAELRETVTKSPLVIPDSIGIVYAVRYLFGIKCRRTTGIDLIHELCRTKSRLFMLGAKQDIIESAVDKLKAAFPGVNIAGYRNGYFSREEENEVIELIRNSKSNILLAGLNSPFQEKWLYNNLNRFNVQIVMGVGGSFDVISGKLRRAPHIMQNLGIEWLYRLAQEPWRINRMRDLPKFVINILKIKQ